MIASPQQLGTLSITLCRCLEEEDPNKEVVNVKCVENLPDNYFMF